MNYLYSYFSYNSFKSGTKFFKSTKSFTVLESNLSNNYYIYFPN